MKESQYLIVGASHAGLEADEGLVVLVPKSLAWMVPAWVMVAAYAPIYAMIAADLARALRRVGVVDVGSNSVRLVVFDGAARSPAYFYNEKIMCALGAGLAETGQLNPEGRKRAVNEQRRR